MVSQGSFFLAEGFGFREDGLAAGERAVRLLIAEAPQGRQFGQPGEARVLGHDDGGLGRGDEKRSRGSAASGDAGRNWLSAPVKSKLP